MENELTADRLRYLVKYQFFNSKIIEYGTDVVNGRILLSRNDYLIKLNETGVERKFIIKTKNIT